MPDTNQGRRNMFERVKWLGGAAGVAAVLTFSACAAATGDADPEAGDEVSASASSLLSEANTKFDPLPTVMQSAKHPVTDAKVTLGRQLFFEKRLSKNQDLACNTCHALTSYGVDIRGGAPKVSTGHRGQLGTRNAPTVYNAALHIAEFWDGRSIDVEDQAQGPVLNPVEMAMPNAAAVVTVLKSIPGYAPLFKAAFPGVADPITLANAATAIGAFERKLVTKDRFDDYLDGDMKALTAAELDGLAVFMDAGCPSCHKGPGLGGGSYEKLGVFMTVTTDDLGRYNVTKRAADKYVFKVPSLRNIDKTAPYFHDGSQATLADAVTTMSAAQTVDGKLSPAEVAKVVTFLKSLSGEIPAEYIKEPAALPGSASTPAPDPT
jgi:cytochrome c peroxidase